MDYPLFERSDGFYYQLALMPDWEDRLVRMLDVEDFSRSRMDEAERTIIHFNRLGYSVREISWYYGTSRQNMNYKLGKVFHRLAVRCEPVLESAAPEN